MSSKYRKKPVVIDAMQWDGTATSATGIIDWILSENGSADYHCGLGARCQDPTTEHKLRISTLEGNIFASAGDYVIRGTEGEFYPCKPAAFDATFEPVAEVTS